jgi:hypothetical protein
LSKWFRKFDRWIAVPTALIIPVAVIIKLVGNPQIVAAWTIFIKGFDKAIADDKTRVRVGPVISANPTSCRVSSSYGNV